MTASLAVAKKKPSPVDEAGPVPQDHASVRYKLAVRAKLVAREWGYDEGRDGDGTGQFEATETTLLTTPSTPK